jgi:RNA-directed DNA polymerase
MQRLIDHLEKNWGLRIEYLMYQIYVVNRLQIRITKAVKKGKWYLVKRLQHLLTHSHYAKLLATRNPTLNKGKRTAGIDGETWSSSEIKMKAALSLT